jgi:glycine hydroxymethyltransferase
MVLNANTVPGETRSPFLASGIRIGTPAITTRGFTETDCKFVGELIVKMINNPHEDATKSFVLNEIKTLCEKYPLYL